MAIPLLVLILCLMYGLSLQAVHKSIHTIELGRNRLCHVGGMDTLKQGFLASSSLCNIGLMDVGLNVEGE